MLNQETIVTRLFRFRGALLPLACAGILLFTFAMAGCGGTDDGDPEQTAVDKTPTPKPPAAPTPEVKAPSQEELLGELAEADDFFKWFSLRGPLLKTGGESASVKRMLDKKAEELRKKRPYNLESAAQYYNLNESVELLDLQYKRMGEEKDGKIRHRIQALVYVKKETSKHCVFQFAGMVDRKHVGMLDSEEDKKRNGTVWTLNPQVPTENWKAGEYYLLKHSHVYSFNIPYEMRVSMGEKDKDTGKWLGIFGRAVNMGWHIDLGE